MNPQLTSTNLRFYSTSIVNYQGVEYGLASSPLAAHLVVLAPRLTNALEAFEGDSSEFNDKTLLVGPQSAHNASALRAQLPWLQPKALGLNTSFGMGDRLGIATPGHVRAVREVQGRISPIFAQQSIREMTRTGRTPQHVMDDATWGVFEEGWRGDIGADADHLKTTDDIDQCLAAGFTLFTIDPGGYVDNVSQSDSLNRLYEKAERLPAHMQLKQTGLLGKIFNFEEIQIVMDEPTLLKAMVKYGNATAHVVTMVEHLQRVAKLHSFEIEISMKLSEKATTVFSVTFSLLS